MEATLILSHIVSREEKAIPGQDRRRRLTYVIASYHDTKGNEYRKAFQSYGNPIVPLSGTHEELNSMKRQF